MTISMQHVRGGIFKDVPNVNWKNTVSPNEVAEALAMWRDGFDTYEIAQALNIYEAVIYANLPKWRGGAYEPRP